MKPIKVMLSGFAGIASGTGKGTLTLDLTKLSEDMRLIAIVGANGSGKTTLMDNMHPYRVMPSRASSPTPSAFSYYDHMAANAMNATKELWWEHDGRLFKTLISLTKAGKSRKQEAFLFVSDDQGQTFHPYVTPEGMISDGKTETYDACVERICGKPEIFFTTQFSHQGKAPLNTMTAGEVKSLLASMLGADGVKELGVRAAEVSKSLKPYLDAIKSANAPNLAKAASLDSVLAKQGSLNDQRQTVSELIVAAKSEVRELTMAMGQVRVQFEQQAVTQARKTALEQEMESAVMARDLSVSRVKAQYTTARTALQEQVMTLDRTIATHQSSLVYSRSQMAEAMAIVGKKPVYEHAKSQLDRLVQMISDKRSIVESLTMAIEPLQSLRTTLSQCTESMSDLKNQGTHLASLLDTAKRVSALTDEVPCKGMPIQGKCQLLSDACQAKNNVPEYTVKLQGLRVKYKTQSENGSVTRNVINGLLEQESKLKHELAELETLQDKRQTLFEEASQLKRVPEAEKLVAEMTEQIASIEASLKTLSTAVSEAKLKLQSLEQTEKDESRKAYEQADADVKRLEKIIGDLPPTMRKEALDKYSLAVSQAEEKLDALENKRAEIDQNLAKLQTSLNEIANAKSEIAMADKKCQRISDETAYWNLLATAFSNNGIVALSIDDAGPAISSIANKLLDECYGGRFQIRLATQRATASGVLKEDFEILVTDATRGEEKDIGTMSGGERVWINECLVRAFGLYMTQASGQHFSALFSDETDGPLDPERKRQFMAMKRAVLKVGGYDREFFVTQTPALWDLADHTIDVTSL